VLDGFDEFDEFDEAVEVTAAASFASASLARLASMPVPAASPITATESIAMMTERINTIVEHPQMVAFLADRPGSDGRPPLAPL
jgi:hypothetical protein